MSSKLMIKVEPEELRFTAAKIRERCDEYTKAYTQLFNEIEAMSSAWQGVDNIAFTNQIKGFADDFQKMRRFSADYAVLFEKAANVYDDIQNQIANEARVL